MGNPAMVTDAFARINEMLHQSVGDLTSDELLAPPKPTIGWLVWHLARVQDKNISGLAGQEQAWIADGWHARFDMPPEPVDYASGHSQTPEQIDAFTVKDSKLLLDYLDAVCERTQAYLSTLSVADLERVLDEPQYDPLPTVSVRLVSVVVDNLRHIGQVEFLRGFLRQGGWFPNPDRARKTKDRYP
jgi:uncharacterized damage-inducible protein DinB